MLPDYFNLVFLEIGVSGKDRYAFLIGLGDKEFVEWVPVVIRQTANAEGVIHLD
jgi:hypothetical protein